jgi:hypothetical protein
MNIEPVYSDAAERGTSRNFALARMGILAGMMLAGEVSAGHAQRSQTDSIAERLRRAEAAIAVLQQQLGEQAQSGVKARSGVRLELSGRVLMNAFGNTRRVNNVDNPQFIPDPAAGVQARGGGIAIRQTRLALALTAPDVLGGAFTGDVDVDFYGGQQPSSGGRTFPLLRLRTARGTVRWSSAHLMIGQESPLISGVNPVTLAAIGTPLFATAGNLWLWLPQVRGGVEYGGTVRLGLQGAVLAPTSGDPAAPFNTDYDAAERSQRPYLQARVSAKWGDAELVREIGCGVHRGWLVPTSARVDTRAIACDVVLPVYEWVGVRGEFFDGQALSGLGGGGIGQNFAPANEPLKTTGAWAQVNLRPIALLSLGAGCGGDHPEATALRRRNDACAAYTVARPAGPFFYGVEFRRMRTSYAAGRFTNDHVTLAAGFEF